MRRASPQTLVVLGVLLLGLRLGSGSTLLASPTGRASAALTADERATLLQYAEVGYRYWGFSPAASPRGGYEVYGVKALGTYSLGYFSHEIGPPVPPPPMPHSTLSTHGVVTPHASFLALSYAPHEAVANLRALSGGLPIYGPLGFQDSVDVSEGVTSGRILALDQGMIMAAIANELADDAMQHAFSDGLVEQIVRPLIALEQFSAGLPGQLIGGQPTVLGSQDGGRDGGRRRIQFTNTGISRTARTVTTGSIAPQ
ncbi:MAG: glucoamylase family protein [Isosphaeraceae bacterium]